MAKSNLYDLDKFSAKFFGAMQSVVREHFFNTPKIIHPHVELLSRISKSCEIRGGCSDFDKDEIDSIAKKTEEIVTEKINNFKESDLYRSFDANLRNSFKHAEKTIRLIYNMIEYCDEKGMKDQVDWLKKFKRRYIGENFQVIEVSVTSLPSFYDILSGAFSNFLHMQDALESNPDSKNNINMFNSINPKRDFECFNGTINKLRNFSVNQNWVVRIIERILEKHSFEYINKDKVGVGYEVHLPTILMSLYGLIESSEAKEIDVHASSRIKLRTEVLNERCVSFYKELLGELSSAEKDLKNIVYLRNKFYESGFKEVDAKNYDAALLAINDKYGKGMDSYIMENPDDSDGAPTYILSEKFYHDVAINQKASTPNKEAEVYLQDLLELKWVFSRIAGSNYRQSIDLLKDIRNKLADRKNELKKIKVDQGEGDFKYLKGLEKDIHEYHAMYQNIIIRESSGDIYASFVDFLCDGKKETLKSITDNLMCISDLNINEGLSFYRNFQSDEACDMLVTALNDIPTDYLVEFYQQARRFFNNKTLHNGIGDIFRERLLGNSSEQDKKLILSAANDNIYQSRFIKSVLKEFVEKDKNEEYFKKFKFKEIINIRRNNVGGLLIDIFIEHYQGNLNSDKIKQAQKFIKTYKSTALSVNNNGGKGTTSLNEKVCNLFEFFTFFSDPNASKNEFKTLLKNTSKTSLEYIFYDNGSFNLLEYAIKSKKDDFILELLDELLKKLDPTTLLTTSRNHNPSLASLMLSNCSVYVIKETFKKMNRIKRQGSDKQSIYQVSKSENKYINHNKIVELSNSQYFRYKLGILECAISRGDIKIVGEVFSAMTSNLNLKNEEELLTYKMFLNKAINFSCNKRSQAVTDYLITKAKSVGFYLDGVIKIKIQGKDYSYKGTGVHLATLACRRGRNEAFDSLFAGLKDTSDNARKNFLEAAIKSGNIATVKHLINKYKTPLNNNVKDTTRMLNSFLQAGFKDMKGRKEILDIILNGIGSTPKKDKEKIEKIFFAPNYLLKSFAVLGSFSEFKRVYLLCKELGINYGEKYFQDILYQSSLNKVSFDHTNSRQDIYYDDAHDKKVHIEERTKIIKYLFELYPDMDLDIKYVQQILHFSLNWRARTEDPGFLLVESLVQNCNSTLKNKIINELANKLKCEDSTASSFSFLTRTYEVLTENINNPSVLSDILNSSKLFFSPEKCAMLLKHGAVIDHNVFFKEILTELSGQSGELYKKTFDSILDNKRNDCRWDDLHRDYINDLDSFLNNNPLSESIKIIDRNLLSSQQDWSQLPELINNYNNNLIHHVNNNIVQMMNNSIGTLRMVGAQPVNERNRVGSEAYAVTRNIESCIKEVTRLAVFGRFIGGLNIRDISLENIKIIRGNINRFHVEIINNIGEPYYTHAQQNRVEKSLNYLDKKIQELSNNRNFVNSLLNPSIGADNSGLTIKNLNDNIFLLIGMLRTPWSDEVAFKLSFDTAIDLFSPDGNNSIFNGTNSYSQVNAYYKANLGVSFDDLYSVLCKATINLINSTTSKQDKIRIYKSYYMEFFSRKVDIPEFYIAEGLKIGVEKEFFSKKNLSALSAIEVNKQQNVENVVALENFEDDAAKKKGEIWRALDKGDSIDEEDYEVAKSIILNPDKKYGYRYPFCMNVVNHKIKYEDEQVVEALFESVLKSFLPKEGKDSTKAEKHAFDTANGYFGLILDSFRRLTEGGKQIAFDDLMLRMESGEDRAIRKLYEDVDYLAKAFIDAFCVNESSKQPYIRDIFYAKVLTTLRHLFNNNVLQHEPANGRPNGGQGGDGREPNPKRGRSPDRDRDDKGKGKKRRTDDDLNQNNNMEVDSIAYMANTILKPFKLAGDKLLLEDIKHIAKQATSSVKIEPSSLLSDKNIAAKAPPRISPRGVEPDLKKLNENIAKQGEKIRGLEGALASHSAPKAPPKKHGAGGGKPKGLPPEPHTPRAGGGKPKGLPPEPHTPRAGGGKPKGLPPQPHTPRAGEGKPKGHPPEPYTPRAGAPKGIPLPPKPSNSNAGPSTAVRGASGVGAALPPKRRH